MEVLGFAAFIVFLGYLADVLRRSAAGRRGGIAAGTGIVAGAVMVAVKLGSAAPIMALWVDHSAISPQLALVLNDLGGVAFVISWLPSAIFVAAAAAALHRAGLVRRPTAYCGFVLGAAGLVLTIIGIHDPFSANPLAFLLGLLWLLAVSVRLAIRPGTGASAGKASGRPMPASRSAPSAARRDMTQPPRPCNDAMAGIPGAAPGTGQRLAAWARVAVAVAVLDTIAGPPPS